MFCPVSNQVNYRSSLLVFFLYNLWVLTVLFLLSRNLIKHICKVPRQFLCLGNDTAHILTYQHINMSSETQSLGNGCKTNLDGIPKKNVRNLVYVKSIFQVLQCRLSQICLPLADLCIPGAKKVRFPCLIRGQ